VSRAADDALITGAATLAASWLAGTRRPPVQQGQPGPKATLRRSLVAALREADVRDLGVAAGRHPVGTDWTAGAAPVDLSGHATGGAAVWVAELEVEHPDQVMWGALRALGAARGADAGAYLLVAETSYGRLVDDFAELFGADVGERRVQRPTADLVRGGRVGWSAALAAHPGERPLRAPRTIATTLLAEVPVWDDHVLKALSLEAVDAAPIGFDRLGWPQP
jgi:hypothetical protein